MTRLRRSGGAAAFVATALLTAGCGGHGRAVEPGEERPDGRLVLVSGRDDHGEQRLQSIDVYDGPGGRHVTGSVPAGTLARVSAIEGQMLLVSTAEGPPATGWVDDFHLRGVLHLVGPPPDCRARLAGELREPGMQVTVMSVRGGELLLQAVADPAVRGWAPRQAVRELPPRDRSCGEEPPDAHPH